MATFKDISDALFKAIDQTVQPNNLSKYARSSAADIKRRTRLGYGVSSNGGKREKLKALDPKYVTNVRSVGKKRDGFRKKKGGGYAKKYKKGANLSSETTPKKSNLTFTGQLLNAIIGLSPSKGLVKITFNENRKDGVKNSDIVLGQEDQGRPFFYLTRTELKRLKDKLRVDLKRNIVGRLKSLL